MDLQDEIERIEGIIADRRELYNDQVYRYNTKIATVPGDHPGLALPVGDRASSSRPSRPTRSGPDVELTRHDRRATRRTAQDLARPPRADRVGAARPAHRPDRHPAHRCRARAGRRTRRAAPAHDADRRPPFALVLTSPRIRASETAAPGRVSPTPTVEPDLAEWDYGALEGLLTPTIRETYPDWSIWTGPWPDGETADEVGRRADRVLARAARRRRRRPAVLARPLPPRPRRAVGRPRGVVRPPVQPLDRHALDPRLGSREPGRRDLERGVPPCRGALSVSAHWTAGVS